jgi:hypothetical protein
VRKSKFTHYLMGMVQGHFEIENSEDTIKLKCEKGGKSNAGIAIVIPIQKVVEIVDMPEFVAHRVDWVARKQRESGYVADSTKLGEDGDVQ